MRSSIHDMHTRIFEWVDRAGSTPAARAKRTRRRLRQVVAVLGLAVVFAYAAAVFAVMYVDDVRKYAEGNVMARTRIETRRGDVLDRHGVTLATSLRADSVTADPRWVLPPGVKPSKMPFDSDAAKAYRAKVAERVAMAIDRPVSEVRRRLDKPVGFTYLAKHIDAKGSRNLGELLRKGKLPGISIEPEFVRYYPNNQLAGALVGRPTQTGSIEASFDAVLRGQVVELYTYKDSGAKPIYFDGAPEPGVYGGRTLKLTIDEKIQAIAEHHLAAAVREFIADHGVAVVLDIDTAEVLALAVAPSIDPNDARNKPKYGWHNIAVEHQYEPGSTFKAFTLAIALAEKAVSLDEVIATGAPLVIGSKVVKDDHPHAQVTGLQALQVSSNIAMAKMAMRLDREVFHRHLVDLGFGRRLDLGITGEGAGQLAPPGKWSRIQFANIAFGQGVAVTPLQMAAAYAALANGGLYRRPVLVREELSPDGKGDRTFAADKGKRVFSQKTSEQMRLAMASVCQARNPDGTSLGGTGTSARLPNYLMGGKTGTAQQADPKGGYSDTHWVGTFVGVAPIDRPKLVILVTIDTPTKYDPLLGKIARYGGIVAAPVVREIARFALPYMGVPPSPGAPYLDRNDPDKARLQDEQRKLAGAQAADQLAAQLGATSELPQAATPTAVAAETEPLPVLEPGLGEVRVPDLRRLALRVAREQLAQVGLELKATGSGVAVGQGPLPGAIVAEGSAVRVTFRRLSELAESAPLPVQGALAAPAAAATPAPIAIVRAEGPGIAVRPISVRISPTSRMPRCVGMAAAAAPGGRP
jgi:cell division protein FtsI (penicillin-binding protein 3)